MSVWHYGSSDVACFVACASVTHGMMLVVILVIVVRYHYLVVAEKPGLGTKMLTNLDARRARRSNHLVLVGHRRSIDEVQPTYSMPDQLCSTMLPVNSSSIPRRSYITEIRNRRTTFTARESILPSKNSSQRQPTRQRLSKNQRSNQRR